MISLTLTAGCSVAGHHEATAGHHVATGSGETEPTTTAPAAPSSGTLVGTFAMYGGVETTNGCGCHLEKGTIRLSVGHGMPLVIHVSKSGRFSAQVPAGRYRVEAGTGGATHWPMGSCRLLLIADQPDARPTPHQYLTVRQSRTTQVAVGCEGE